MNRVLLTLALGAWAACGSTPVPDGGPPVEAQAYFALNPGVCFHYADDAGDLVSLDVVPVVSPAGVAIVRSHSGVEQEKDFLTFDAGEVYLAERSFTEAGLTNVYEVPLSYLVAPLNRTALNSSSAYTEGNTAGMQTEGYETLVVNPDINVQPWTGYGASSGEEEDKLSFAFTDADGGAVVFSWLSPTLGFTDLFLADPSGVYVDYLLTGVTPDDAGCF